MTITNGPDFEMFRGEERVWTLTITEDGAAVDLSLATIKFAVRSKYPHGSIISDADAIFTCVSPTEILLTAPALGIVELVVAKAKTYSLDITVNTTYRYGLEYVSNGGTELRVVAQGNFTIHPDIVRAL